MRRFAAGVRCAWQVVPRNILTNVQRMSHQCRRWPCMDYGLLGRGTDTDLATILVLVQRLHGAVWACQVLHKNPEPHAIDCVLAYLDTWGSSVVLPKVDNEPAIQALVDAVRVKRDERTMVEKCPE